MLQVRIIILKHMLHITIDYVLIEYDETVLYLLNGYLHYTSPSFTPPTLTTDTLSMSHTVTILTVGYVTHLLGSPITLSIYLSLLILH